MKTLLGILILIVGVGFSPRLFAQESTNPHTICNDHAAEYQRATGLVFDVDCENVCGYGHVGHYHRDDGVHITSYGYDARVVYPHYAPYATPPRYVQVPRTHYGYATPPPPPPRYPWGYGPSGWHDRRNAPAHPPYYDGYERATQSGFNFFGLFYKHNQEVYREPRGK